MFSKEGSHFFALFPEGTCCFKHAILQPEIYNDVFVMFTAGTYNVAKGSINTYDIRAEVGLLTRNIKIEGNDYNDLFDESFGARVLVGTFTQNEIEYRGKYHQYLI